MIHSFLPREDDTSLCCRGYRISFTVTCGESEWQMSYRMPKNKLKKLIRKHNRRKKKHKC